jgi:hypothetical protein
MKRYLSVLLYAPGFALLTLSIIACSSFQGSVYNSNTRNPVTTNLTEKALALAMKAYMQLDSDTDSQTVVMGDLEHAYIANGVSPAVIKPLFKKQDDAKTAEEKDSEMDALARNALNDKKPNVKLAVQFASNIKKLAAKSEVLLLIAEHMPKDNRLAVLREADKAIVNLTEPVYEKRSKLLKLARMYFESGDKQNARKTVLSSHDLLIRNPSSINAIDFGIAAELESQLGLQPGALCKRTRFLHKNQHRPIALAKITAAYIQHGYQGQVCIPDRALIEAVKKMPDAASRVPEQLALAEAWHTRSEKDKSSQLYRDAIQSAELVNPPHYRFDMQSKVLISLKKTNNKKRYNTFSKKYWSQVNKQSSYEQSSTLMQLAWEAYDTHGLSDLSLVALQKMKDHILTVTTAVTLARIAQKKNDQDFANQALTKALLASKAIPYPTSKLDQLRVVIDTAHTLDNNELAGQALKLATQSLANIPHPDLKVMYATLLTKQAWEHKDYRLAQQLLNKNHAWYEQWLKQPAKAEKGTANGIDYQAENKKNAGIDLIKANVLLGNNARVITLLNGLQNKNQQAKALVYAAITLVEKCNKQGITKKDTLMLKALEKKLLMKNA